MFLVFLACFRIDQGLCCAVLTTWIDQVHRTVDAGGSGEIHGVVAGYEWSKGCEEFTFLYLSLSQVTMFSSRQIS